MNKKIIKEIRKEQKRQRVLFGVQKHAPLVWIAIISGELGGAAEQYLKKDMKVYRTELIHVVASAVSALECFERRKKK